MKKIKRRNLVSPVSYKSMNRQLMLGNYTVGLAIWLLYVGFSFILYQDAMLTMNGLFLVFNSLVLMIFIQAFSFMIAKFTGNREIFSGVRNLFGMGSSFICDICTTKYVKSFCFKFSKIFIIILVYF
ncbi:MAG: hypothetical protein V8R63_10095 [Thomasclavelia ramosa]